MQVPRSHPLRRVTYPLRLHLPVLQVLSLQVPLLSCRPSLPVYSICGYRKRSVLPDFRFLPGNIIISLTSDCFTGKDLADLELHFHEVIVLDLCLRFNVNCGFFRFFCCFRLSGKFLLFCLKLCFLGSLISSTFGITSFASRRAKRISGLSVTLLSILIKSEFVQIVIIAQCSIQLFYDLLCCLRQEAVQ